MSDASWDCRKNLTEGIRRSEIHDVKLIKIKCPGWIPHDDASCQCDVELYYCKKCKQIDSRRIQNGCPHK